MSVTIFVAVGLLSPFATVLGFLLYYSNQAITNLRSVLEANRAKRDGVILELHKDAKTALDHVAASIRAEVLQNNNGASALTSERIVYFRDRTERAYFLLDDAKDIRDSLKVSSMALAKIRRYGIILLLSMAIATFTLALVPRQYLEGLGSLWALVFMVEIPIYGTRIFKNYKTYKIVGDLLSNHGVGVHDESK